MAKLKERGYVFENKNKSNSPRKDASTGRREAQTS
jgi:hypothetical protein